MNMENLLTSNYSNLKILQTNASGSLNIDICPIQPFQVPKCVKYTILPILYIDNISIYILKTIASVF